MDNGRGATHTLSGLLEASAMDLFLVFHVALHMYIDKGRPSGDVLKCVVPSFSCMIQQQHKRPVL